MRTISLGRAWSCSSPRPPIKLALPAHCDADMRRSLQAVVSNNLRAAVRNLRVPEAATRAFLSGLDGTVLLKGDGKVRAALLHCCMGLGL